MAIATFGSKVFEVSKNRIYTPDGLSVKESINLEDKEVEGKKPSTHIKGKNLLELSFSLQLDTRFVNVENEIQWWRNTLNSTQAQIFTLGGRPISVNKMLLKSVDVGETLIGRNGEYLRAVLSLEFQEFVSVGYKKKTSSKKSSSKKRKSSQVKNIKTVEKNKKPPRKSRARMMLELAGDTE